MLKGLLTAVWTWHSFANAFSLVQLTLKTQPTVSIWPYPWAKNILSEKRKKNMSCPVFFYLALGGEIWLYKSRRIWRAERCWDGVMHWGHPPGDSDILWSSPQLRRGRCMTNGTANQETSVIHHSCTPWHGPSGSTCSEGAVGSSQALRWLSYPSGAAGRQFNLSNVPKRQVGHKCWLVALRELAK